MRKIEAGLSTSLTEISNNLIVSLAGEMTDDNIAAITDIIMTKTYKINIHGAILNFSMVSVMDSYTYKSFRNITKALALMGVKVVWVGLRPGVVCALMDLNVNIDADKICTAINLEQGLAMLSYDKHREKKDL